MNIKLLSGIAALIAAIATLVGAFKSHTESSEKQSAVGDGNVLISGSNNSVVMGGSSRPFQFESPEKDISSILMGNEGARLSDLQSFLNHYKFEGWLDRGAFVTRLMYNGTTDPSPDARMILVFAAPDQRVCAVIHTRDIDINSEARDVIEGSSRRYMVTLTQWCHHNDNMRKALSMYYYEILRNSD